MGNHQHTIEVNGTRYDALTGAKVAHHTTKKIVPVQVHPHRRNIDGVHQASKKVASKAVHAKPARSQTLMRSIVAKPHITATSAAIDKTVEDFSARRALEELRLHRAKKVPTSKMVSRFGIPEVTSTTIKPQHTTLAVKPEPVVAVAPTTPPQILQQPAAAAQKDHFQSQIEHASAHTKKPLKKPKLRHRAAKKLHVSPRSLSAATAVFAFLVLGGFIAYQNSAVIAVRVAASRAGVAAAVPGYTPAGFSLKTHSSKPGQITIGYRSNSDARAYQITQTTSSWDSNTLLENFVASNPYQTTASKGRTIYLYDGNNATWVDNGVWFKVEGNANLSSDQLQHLIDSI